MLRHLKNQKGFTLIELMIVVAIIGILSAIAIPNFMTFRIKAKTAEAKSNLGSIRTCELSYRAENDVYPAVTRYPSAAATGSSNAWVSASTEFSAIGFAPSGKVYYDYVVDGIGADTFTAYAYGDLDDDDEEADYQIAPNTDITNVSRNNIY